MATGDGFDALVDTLADRTTVLAGPSGAGKSSFINRLYQEATNTRTEEEPAEREEGGGLGPLGFRALRI